MEVCVVGHGPSLQGAELGNKIDSYDKVVRLKGSTTVVGTKDFGSKSDALCASTEIMGVFLKSDAEEYWAYPKNGYFDGKNAINVISTLGKPVMIPLNLTNQWNENFRAMGGRHPNFSTGMAAILYSLYRWKPKTVYLAGFDTLMDPKRPFSRHDLVPRSGVGPFPDHDWEMENRLLKVLEEVYDAEILCIPT